MPDRPPSLRVQPDPEFADRLERVLVQQLTTPTTRTEFARLDPVATTDSVSDHDGAEEQSGSIELAPVVATRRTAGRLVAAKIALGATAAVLIAALVVTLTVLSPNRDESDPADVPPPTTHTPSTTVAPAPTSPFVGIWLSTDTDGSAQTMEIVHAGDDDYDIEIHDDAATACAGAPAAITGTGSVTDTSLVIPQAELACDDGSTPRIGLPPQPDLANYALHLDTATGELIDTFGVVWHAATDPPVDEPESGIEPAADPPADLTDLGAGEMVDLPEWPLGERTTPPMVWTGTELIVWGEGIYGFAGDGAALDLANATWRVIAPAPIEARSEAAVVWTGTEMIVWGGISEYVPEPGGEAAVMASDGAAYDPATDTWRLLPPPPAGVDLEGARIVWTDHEVVLLGRGAAAYDPATDGWRTLADPPALPTYQRPVWTGDSIVAANAGYGASGGEDGSMARYDLAADRWTLVEIGSSTAVVGVPGSDGRVGTFVNLLSETGAPVQLIDSTGTQIAELPAFPADPAVFGEELWAYGLWVGDEAVFEIWSDEPDYAGEQIWALNPGTQAWRRLDADTAFPRIDHSVLAAGDRLLMWNRPSDVYRGSPRACCVAPPSRGGAVYRVGSAATD